MIDIWLVEPEIGFMKITLDLPKDLVMEVKLRAVQERRKFKDMVAELLRKGLASPADATSEKKPSPLSTDPVTGLPIIRGEPNSPGSKMTTEEVYAMIHQTQEEEDLARVGLSLDANAFPISNKRNLESS